MLGKLRVAFSNITRKLNLNLIQGGVWVDIFNLIN